MKEKLKTVIKGAEKELEQFASEMSSGKQWTDKDPARIGELMKIIRDGKLLCLLEDIKEKGLMSVMNGSGSKDNKSKEGGEESKDPMEMLKKMFGGGQQSGGFGMQNTGGWSPLQMQHHIPGISPTSNYNNYDYSPENRRGVPGSGHRYSMDNHYDDTEMRHRGKNGQYVRNHYDDGMDDRYMSPDNRQGGDTSPQNSTVITDKQGVPGTGVGTQGR